MSSEIKQDLKIYGGILSPAKDQESMESWLLPLEPKLIMGKDFCAVLTMNAECVHIGS